MGCYWEDYWVRVGTWVGSTSWRTGQDHDSNGRGRSYLGTMVTSAGVLAVLLVIGGVEQNTGPIK